MCSGHGIVALGSKKYDFVDLGNEHKQYDHTGIKALGYVPVLSEEEVVEMMGLSPLPHRSQLIEISFDDTESYGMCTPGGHWC